MSATMSILTPLQRLRSMLSLDKQQIRDVYVYAFFTGIVNLSLPLGLQAIINLIQGGEVNSSWILLVSIVIFGVALTGVFQILQLKIVERIAQKIMARSAFDFAFRIPRIKNTLLDNYFMPEMANRFFDTLTLQKGLPKLLIDFTLALFQIAAGLLLLSFYHPFFIVFSIIFVMVLYIILAIIAPKGLKTSLQESKRKYAIAFWLEEIARSRFSIKFNNEHAFELKKADQLIVDYVVDRNSHFRVLLNQYAWMVGFKVLITSGLLLLGGILVFQEQMNIGQFVAAEIIILLIISSTEKLIQSLDSIYDILTALEKIGHVTDFELDKHSGIEFSNTTQEFSIGCQNVSFKYQNQNTYILENVSFVANAGESVCLTGKAGSGKSTLIKLLCGLEEPSEGLIKINNFPLPSINLQSLKSRIGIVTSEDAILQASLLDNITFGDTSVTPNQLMEALHIVGLSQFISTVPQGLNTRLDPLGIKIPKSIKNKILLARAIVRKPNILILEDPLDHIPIEEKTTIIQRLLNKKHGWTCVISSVDQIWTEFVDRVIFLENKF